MDYQKFNEIDFRNLDINSDEAARKIVGEQIQVWIEDATTQMNDEQIKEIWRENENYYESNQVPIGTTNNALREFVRNNFDTGLLDQGQFRVKRDKHNMIYFVDNKLGQIVDRMAGDLTGAEKVISVEQDDDPHNDNLERIVRHYLDSLFYRKKFWTNSGRIAIKEMLKLGLYWIDVDYDSEINVPLGDIFFTKFHPKDVLVDPLSTEEYFLDARYVIPKVRMEYYKAVEYLKQFGVDPMKIMPDTDDSDYTYYNQSSRNRNRAAGNDKFVTIFLPQFKIPYRSDFSTKDYSSGQEGEAILKRKEMYSFKAVYTRGLGVVSHKLNKYTDKTQLDQYQFSVIPLYDKKNATRLYPGSTIEKLKNIQDIINITKSMILNKERDRSRVRVVVASMIKSKEPQLWQNFIDFGGQYEVDAQTLTAAGGNINNLIREIKMDPVDPSIYQFLQIAEDSLKNQSIQHEALEGNYPKDNLSGVAIQKLQERNNVTLLNKPQNIEWAFTQIGQYVYNIIATEYTAEHFMKMNNNSLKAPINKVFTGIEFENFIKNASPELPPDEALADFEKENLVEVIYTSRSVQDSRLLSGNEIKSEGMAVFVNFLKAPEGSIYNLGIRIKLDVEAERNKLEEKIVASQLLQQGKFPLSLFLEMQGGYMLANKDRILKDLEDENKIQSIAKEIADRGEQFVNDFMQFAQKYDAMKKQGQQQQNNQQQQIPTQQNQNQLQIAQ